FSFFTDPATPELYTLSLHDALPICAVRPGARTDHARDPIFTLGDGSRSLSGRPPHRVRWSFARAVSGGAAPDLRSRGRRAKDHRSEEHTSELQSRGHLVCRLLLEKK